MAKISVYIIAYNEANKIKPAIASVINWADEVIVADSFSTDDTVNIATNMGAKVIQIPFKGFGDLRNHAIAACQHEWIFSLDSDERCTPEARDEMLAICKANDLNGPIAYFVPRRNYFLGRWVKHSGWYPDYRQPQLFRNGKMRYDLQPVHESFVADGPLGYLSNAIWQFPFENLAQLLHKANRYSSLGAEKLKDKKRGGIFKALWHAKGIFLRNYFFRLGFLDGRAGFMIALGNFIGTFFKYAKLAELQNDWQEPVVHFDRLSEMGVANIRNPEEKCMDSRLSGNDEEGRRE